MRQAVSSIAIAAAGLFVSSCGAIASAATAAKPARPPEPLVVVARANMPAVVVPSPVNDIVTTPPTLLAQTIVPVPPDSQSTAAVISPGSIVRAVAPGGPQPGAWWVLAMGAVLCRVGARFLRVS